MSDLDADRIGRQRRWTAAAAGAAVVMVVTLALLRVPQAPPAIALPKAATRPPVELARSSTLGEETQMHDQAPLFVPTEFNATLPEPTRPEAGRSMLDRDDLRWHFGELALRLGLPPPVDVPKQPAAWLTAGAAAAPLHGFGRVDEGASLAPARGGFVEIRTTGTNQRVWAGRIGVEARPPTDKPWRPVEFLATVDASGLVGPPVITERTDFEEVDTYFRNYLARTLRVGELLPPGFYRIVVGP